MHPSFSSARRRCSRGLLLLIPLALSAVTAAELPLSAAEPSPQQLEFFEKEIRPLLIKHCYECHSADGAQEGNLRLDHASLILKGGATGPAAVATKPKESLLIEAVQYRGFQMPPNGKLPEADIAKFIKWVELGLPWPAEEVPAAEPAEPVKTFVITPQQRSHWSFLPLAASPIPQTGSNWPQGAIDQFVLARMTAEGLSPALPAERLELLRRVTFDLTGLPPDPADIQNFLNDKTSEAWAKVVDRLLASPQYGERWGRHWMDVIRYADTAGDASDYPLPDAYKYRNYVIDAFNRDMPYDQFLREQYAGDLLATQGPRDRFEEQTVATTMLALSRRFGYNDTHFHYFHLTIADTIDTMGQSVLGLSIGCARCHDHKFEPISARDYYALYGFFSSTKFTFPGAEEVRFPKDLVPLLPAAEVEQRRSIRQAELNRLAAEVELAAPTLTQADGGFEHQADGKPVAAPWTADARIVVSSAAQSPFTNAHSPGQLGVRLPNSAENVGLLRPFASQAAGNTTTLYANIDLRHVDSPAGSDGYYRIGFYHRQNWSTAWELLVNGGGIALREGTEIHQVVPLQQGVWYNVQLQLDLTTKTASALISNGQDSWSIPATPTHDQWDGLVDGFLVDAHPPGGAVRPAREIDNLAVSLTPQLPATATISESVPAIDWTQLFSTTEQTKQRRSALEKEPLFPTAYAVSEGTVGNTRLQKRGEPERLGDEVPRGFPEVLGGGHLSSSVQESGRRELAEWLTNPANPLTARVMANRVWQYHFGRGIVATSNDFGVRGQPPTHPELLDYLALRLQQNGWSLKALHREILLSSTYQLGTASSQAADQQDPANLWLSHFSRRRLSAEEIRDTLLLVSGELDDARGGPHPFPPVESWTFSQHNAFKAVYDMRQRSVYLMTQRIKRHPFLALFDGPDPNTTTAQRSLTTTPTQALYVMNDDTFHQYSMATAQRLRAQSNTDFDRIDQLAWMALSRPATPEEKADGLAFLEQYRASLPAGEDSDLRSWAAYARVILSSNEFLHLD